MRCPGLNAADAVQVTSSDALMTGVDEAVPDSRARAGTIYVERPPAIPFQEDEDDEDSFPAVWIHRERMQRRDEVDAGALSPIAEERLYGIADDVY